MVSHFCQWIYYVKSHIGKEYNWYIYCNNSGNNYVIFFLFQKLLNRKKALKEKNLEQKEEKKYMSALLIDYMSSEDSDSEDESIFITRPLTWLSDEYREIMQRLDRKYTRSLNAQGKRLKSKRKEGAASQRPCPKKPKGHEWVFS